MVTNVNQTYYGGHFPIYTNNKSLPCETEINMVFYVNYILIKKKN